MTHDFEDEALQLLAIYHSERFRKVSNRYPRRVAEAYAGDLATALVDTDHEVAGRVRDWERSQGLEVRDWEAIGRGERGEVRRLCTTPRPCRPLPLLVPRGGRPTPSGRRGYRGRPSRPR